VKLLNVDLSTVTTAADLIVGLGDPLNEIIHLEFQSSAAAWKHADLMMHSALLFAHYHVPVHTVAILLRPEAAHANLNGTIAYSPRPGRGKMETTAPTRTTEHCETSMTRGAAAECRGHFCGT
jgi:hypothetical protein